MPELATTVALPLVDPMVTKLSDALNKLAASLEQLQAHPIEMHQTVTIDWSLWLVAGLIIGGIGALLIARRLHS